MAPVCQPLNERHGCAVHDACHSDSLPGCYKLAMRMERYMRVRCFGRPRPGAVHHCLPVRRVVLWGHTSAQPHLHVTRGHHAWIARLSKFMDKHCSIRKAGLLKVPTFMCHIASNVKSSAVTQYLPMSFAWNYLQADICAVDNLQLHHTHPRDTCLCVHNRAALQTLQVGRPHALHTAVGRTGAQKRVAADPWELLQT